MGDVPVTVIVMTFNEELNLRRCLEGVAGWTSQLVVVDSFSTDNTLSIADSFGAEIHQHEYASHPAQWNWALENVPIRNQWVLAVDADFVVTPLLRNEIARAVALGDNDIDGYYVRHRQVFRGKSLRWGGIYPRYWLRLFRPGRVIIDPQDQVDLYFYVKGKAGYLKADVLEDNHREKNFSFWVRKQIKFAERQAREEVKRRQIETKPPERPSPIGSTNQRRLWLKKRLLYFPLYTRPFIYFLYRYILRLGFLDGKEGFLYHFSQAFLYRLLVDVNIEELRKEDEDDLLTAPLSRSNAEGP